MAFAADMSVLSKPLLEVIASLEQANEEIAAMQRRLDELLDAAQPKTRTGRLRTKLSLSVREREVVGGLAAGDSYQRIAQELDISINTVRHHVRNAYSKLGVKSAIQAANAISEAPDAQ
jgi:DNA-binding NarL/FixJ family response regulator